MYKLTSRISSIFNIYITPLITLTALLLGRPLPLLLDIQPGLIPNMPIPILHPQSIHHIRNLLPNAHLAPTPLIKELTHLLLTAKTVHAQRLQHVLLPRQADPRCVWIVRLRSVAEQLERATLSQEHSVHVLGGDLLEAGGLPRRRALLDQSRDHALGEVCVRHEARSELVLALEDLRDVDVAEGDHLSGRDFDAGWTALFQGVECFLGPFCGCARGGGFGV